MTAHDYDKALALVKSLAAPCDGGPTVHAWRRCRHCLAVNELDDKGVRELLRAFIETLPPRLPK
jgi:hypothetical protein